MSFFNETAEELVNRLFDKWLKENHFANKQPLSAPFVREEATRRLKIFDDGMIKEAKNNIPDVIEEAMSNLNLQRENIVLFVLAQTFSLLANRALSTPPPKPAHRQEKTKRNYGHLRLVVNG